jgi:hypothetical protein
MDSTGMIQIVDGMANCAVATTAASGFQTASIHVLEINQ